jgi:hypothetical protein
MAICRPWKSGRSPSTAYSRPPTARASSRVIGERYDARRRGSAGVPGTYGGGASSGAYGPLA